MTQHGTHNSRLATIEDLDALLAKHALVPAVVKLNGVTYQVRTDLTANEVQMYIVLMGKELDSQAFTLLVGTKAELAALHKAFVRAQADEDVEIPAGKSATRLSDYLDTLPRMHTALAVGRIMRASKVLAPHTKSEQQLFSEYGYEPEAETPETGESGAS